MSKLKEDLLDREIKRHRATEFILSAVSWIVGISVAYGMMQALDDLNRLEDSSMISYAFLWLTTIVACIYLGNLYSLSKRQAEKIHRRSLREIDKQFENKE